MRDREQLPVELVDTDGNATGDCSVAEAHRPPGRRHRAFSVWLTDPTGRLLLQQRAAGKTRFAGRWSNTCCGHPAPGEPVIAAATRRLADELGVAPTMITPVTESGIYRYRAVDASNAYVEDEWDHVVVGRLLSGVPRPDPAEVARIDWVLPTQLRRAVDAAPEEYTPWLLGVLDVASTPD
ncbi:isopentenyl-diphosphate Delta-isomerase [Skermania piniformis]|uniref:Isopentenyl-diphosphate Delta-isomerase n=1 Tax=Skermania pinensis TaxID=39122 RepID=A0ABX8SBM0_9ACTN|nr:isopentenyl-diphosphate Delta-isomerase [Skermania piniformis]QXQ15178.1 isopentenyl-diphosphate Delta-isomerase [Skermania piniformis]